MRTVKRSLCSDYRNVGLDNPNTKFRVTSISESINPNESFEPSNSLKINMLKKRKVPGPGNLQIAIDWWNFDKAINFYKMISRKLFELGCHSFVKRKISSGLIFPTKRDKARIVKSKISYQNLFFARLKTRFTRHQLQRSASDNNLHIGW